MAPQSPDLGVHPAPKTYLVHPKGCERLRSKGSKNTPGLQFRQGGHPTLDPASFLRVTPFLE